MKPIFVFIAATVALIALSPLRAMAQINVAAASDLTFAMNDIAVLYQKQNHGEVKLAYGSSGNFFAQIESGAPFDVFLSADEDYPKKLVTAGRALPESLRVYAMGRLVIWARSNSPIEISRGMPALLDSRINKIAIANPQHAPYGRAALAALKNAGIYSQVESKLVYGENISQTAQFVSSGNADVGLIALSLAVAPGLAGQGKYFELPEMVAPQIKQAAVAIKGSHAAEALRFIAFLSSQEAAAILKRYGFSVPNANLKSQSGIER